MGTNPFCARTAWWVALFVISPAALGDAPCDAGFRDVTPAERARITAALQSVKSALPPAPEGWQIRGTEEFSIPASICRDGENTPWLFGFGRSYGQVGDYESRQKLMADAAAAAAADRANNQARLDALQAQMMAIMQQQMALNQKQDYAGAEKLQPKLEKAQADYEKLLTAGDQQIEAAGREFQRDLEMSISVGMNAAPQRPGRNVTQLPKPAGAVAALRWQNEDPAVTDEYALYLFGAWKPDPDGGWRMAPGGTRGRAAFGRTRRAGLRHRRREAPCGRHAGHRLREDRRDRQVTPGESASCIPARHRAVYSGGLRTGRARSPCT